MRNWIRMSVAALAVGLLVGCAGTKFVRPTESELVLGKTTESEVRARLGKPFQEATGMTNGASTRKLAYAYASMGLKPKSSGVTGVSALELIFHDGKLVSHAYMSNLAEDATDFDETKVPAIQSGKTTRAEVIRALGVAPGEAMFPVIKQADARAMIYGYQEMRGFTPSAKKLVVVVDRQGVVADVEYQNSGTWGK